MTEEIMVQAKARLVRSDSGINREIPDRGMHREILAPRMERKISAPGMPRERQDSAAEENGRNQVAGDAVAQRLLLREHRLEIYVNEQLFARLVCTSNDLDNLVAGRLVTEGIIKDMDEVVQFYLCESGNRARIFLKGDVKWKQKEAEEPTCCTDNHVFLRRTDNVDNAIVRHEADGDTAQGQAVGNPADVRRQEAVIWKPEWIFSLAEAFARDSALHRSTGGTHSCMLAIGGQICYRAEDIGRHNALDKAVGYAVREGLDRRECILFTTGRVPTDMVKKVVAAGIPILVSKAVPTIDAVELARENGVTLICRAWPDSYEEY